MKNNDPIDSIELVDWEEMKMDIEMFEDSGVLFSMYEKNGSKLTMIELTEGDGKRVYQFLKKHYE